MQISIKNIPMSKKHRKANASFSNAPQTYAPITEAAEYRIIKHDLLRVIALNVIYLAAVLVVYYTNLKSGYLDRVLGHWLHF